MNLSRIVSLESVITIIIMTVIILVLTTVICIVTLLRKGLSIREYDKFVHTTYLECGKKVPALISRIQNNNICEYNDFLLRYRLFCPFFKKIKLPD